MVETTERLLTILSLLQRRPEWSGPALADELGVTIRTVRRDIDRLRQLGYPVASTTGRTGRYRLTTGGTAIPPLMLDADEAITVAASLRAAAGAGLGTEPAVARRVLAKLEPVLPESLRHQVGALVESTDTLPDSGETVAADVLSTVTQACRDHERLVVDYQRADGVAGERTLDPHRVVATGRRWYLVARDRDRAEWRTYRLDRMRSVRPTGHRVVIDDPPEAAAFVQDAISTAPYEHRVRVEVDASMADLAPLVPPTTAVLSEIDAEHTMVTTGGDRLDLIAYHLLSLDRPFRVIEPAAMRDELARIAGRASSAVSG